MSACQADMGEGFGRCGAPMPCGMHRADLSRPDADCRLGHNFVGNLCERCGTHFAADAAVCQCGHWFVDHFTSHGLPLACNHACYCTQYRPAAFVADVNRPDDEYEDDEPKPVPDAFWTSDEADWLAAYGLRGHVYAESALADLLRDRAVSDREGATEQLAALLAAHEDWMFDNPDSDHAQAVCYCMEPLLVPEDYGDIEIAHRAHVAAVLSERFVITSRETE